MTESSSTGGPSQANGSRRDQATDDLHAALGHLRDAVDRLRSEIEMNAKDEWVRAKPELKTTLGDLQKMIDAAAERAKVVLGGLSDRLDSTEKRDQSN